MENIVILAILIVVMEFAVEGIKKPLEALPLFQKIKGALIPVINILAMTCLILGTNVTILNSLGIVCVSYVDYIFTILICSLGTATWHEFKKKIKEVATKEGDE